MEDQTRGRTTLQQVRAAFADGISAHSAALLLQARDDGHAWEPLTDAVARGLAQRRGNVQATDSPAAVADVAAPTDTLYIEPRRSSARSPCGLVGTLKRRAAPICGADARRSRLLLLAGAAVGYVLLRPVLGLGHELVVAALAQLLKTIVDTGVWEPLISRLGIDPIYAGAAVRAIGGVQVAGFAVAGPIGELVHTAAPDVFLAPEQVASGAGISMVAVAGAPALGRGLVAFGADVFWLAIGLWLFCRFRSTRWTLALLGLFIQAQIAVNHLLDAQVSLADIDASGLPFAVALAIPALSWFTTGATEMAAELRDAIIGTALVLLGYACALVLVVAARTSRKQSGTQPAMRGTFATLMLGVAVVTALSPVGALAVGESNWQLAPAPLLATHRASSHRGMTHTVRLTGATRVDIAATSNGGWQYLVDGVPDAIRGVGYNPQYASLPPEQRSTLYDRDFGEMRRLGINTIEGWFEGQFDNVTLDYAARNNIGVVMPFELNQDWPFENPNVQQSILDHVTEYVLKYRNHPAVRMWSPGNENLHRILYARWVSQENVAAARARADAFAAFLPRLVDRIHELDLRHPVVYRDAEDVYLNRLTAAFNDGLDRPWLVYGANVYSTDRLRQIVGSWPSQWPGRALLVSEFAPGGVGPAQRPIGFEQQWAVIRSRPDVVLGGMAYTWATNGPEDLDRVFGLVDPAGGGTDGALAALSGAYLSDPSY